MEHQINGTPTMSESLKEVLSRPPSSLIRYGAIFLMLAFTAIIATGFLITYSSKVEGDLTLTTTPSPVPVLATSDGLINRFSVQEGEYVRKDSIIGVYESNAILKDIDRLEAEITQLQNYDRDSLISYLPPSGLELGELAPKYAVTRQLLSSFTENAVGEGNRYNNTVYRRIRSKINSTIKELKNKQTLVRNEIVSLESKYKFKQKQYSENKITYDQLSNAQQLLVTKRQEVNSIELEIKDLERQLSDYALQELNSEDNFQKGSAANYLELQRNISDLRKDIRIWKTEHLLRAPVSGRVSFFNFQNNESILVTEGEKLCAILPNTDTPDIIGNINLPIKNSGSIKEGQRVLVRFDNYPSRVYGFVEGIISKKSTLPSNNSYLLKVQFPEGLRTSFDQELEFRIEMNGKATIITKEQRLIHRLFSRFVGLFKG